MNTKNQIREIVEESEILTEEEKELFLEQLQNEPEPFSEEFLALLEEFFALEAQVLAEEEEEIDEMIGKAEQELYSAKAESAPKKKKLLSEYNQVINSEIQNFETESKKASQEFDQQVESVGKEEEQSEIDSIRNMLAQPKQN